MHGADFHEDPRLVEPHTIGSSKSPSRHPNRKRAENTDDDQGPLRLLLIEDNRVDACVIRECLASAGGVVVELEHAACLSDGLSRLKAERFHAVILDLNLPDSRGVRTVVRTHRCAPTVPIVALTGTEEKEAALLVVRAGAEDYLCKSELQPKLLLRAVRYAIERAAHREADKRLGHEETRYRHLLKAITSYTYSVVYANGSSFTRHGLGCLATTGYSPEEFAADRYLWIRIVHPDDQEVVRQYVARIGSGEEVPPIEHRIVHKDGSTRWIRNTIIHRCGESGRLLGYDGVVEDISERKHAEEIIRRREAHLLAAEAIQSRLWPKVAPPLPGFDIAGAVHPAEFAAGDYFDYVPMADGSLGVMIADVSGHGLGPGIVTALTYAHVRSLAQIYSEPTEIMTQVNRFLVDETDPFVTALFARLVPDARLLSWINAGHPPGIILDRADHVKARLESTTLPLAVFSDVTFSSDDSAVLESGDIVLMLTDGVLEAQPSEGSAFGMERALKLVVANRHQAAAEIVGQLIRAVHDHCAPERPPDDVTAAGIKGQEP